MTMSLDKSNYLFNLRLWIQQKADYMIQFFKIFSDGNPQTGHFVQLTVHKGVEHSKHLFAL